MMEQHRKFEHWANDRREICNSLKEMRNFGYMFLQWLTRNDGYVCNWASKIKLHGLGVDFLYNWDPQYGSKGQNRLVEV